MRADVELDIGRKTFASGLLPELIVVLRRSQPSNLVAVVGDEESVGPELETWCRFTGNTLLETTVEKRPHPAGSSGAGLLRYRLRTSALDTFACARPCAGPAMEIVQFWRSAVQADLQHNSIAG